MSQSLEAPLPRLEPPPPHESLDVRMADGAVVRLRRHGNPDGLRLVLSHGNGLAIEAYYPFWKLLLERYDVILFDVRNHGRNPLHREDGHTWARIIDDFEVVFQRIQRAFGERRTAGVFHSLSSIAAIAHSVEVGERNGETRWDPLVLIDPPIYPPETHPLAVIEHDAMAAMGRLARRRPQDYDSPDAFARQLLRNPMFGRWVEGSHMLLARETLRQGEDGRWHLACPREYEAHIFEANVDPTLWPRLPSLSVPIKVIGADPDIKANETPAVLGRALAEEHGLDYTMLDGTTHFLQIEEPHRVLQALEEFLRKHGRI